MKLTRLNDLVREGETLQGKWELDENHELSYRIRGRDEEIKIKGTLIAAEPGTLVAAVTEKQSGGKIVASTVALTGTWNVDVKNRIIFEIEKEGGKKDKLTFTGTWEVDENHEIIYRWERESLRTKTKETQSLVFSGYWDISDRNRLTYYIGGDSDSALRFRGTFQTTSILAKEGEIRYQIGVEINDKKKIQTVVLFGKWKLSKSLELSFEIEYKNGQTKTIAFGGIYNLNDDTAIEVELKTKDGKPLGVTVTLTRDIFDDKGQLFLRLQKSLEESSLEAGMKLEW